MRLKILSGQIHQFIDFQYKLQIKLYYLIKTYLNFAVKVHVAVKFNVLLF